MSYSLVRALHRHTDTSASTVDTSSHDLPVTLVYTFTWFSLQKDAAGSYRVADPDVVSTPLMLPATPVIYDIMGMARAHTDKAPTSTAHQTRSPVGCSPNSMYIVEGTDELQSTTDRSLCFSCKCEMARVLISPCVVPQSIMPPLRVQPTVPSYSLRALSRAPVVFGYRSRPRRHWYAGNDHSLSPLLHRGEKSSDLPCAVVRAGVQQYRRVHQWLDLEYGRVQAQLLGIHERDLDIEGRLSLRQDRQRSVTS